MPGPARPGQAGTFLRLLGEAERQRLRERGAMRTYRAGYFLAIEGEPAREVFVLTEGFATAVCATGEKRPTLLRVYTPGDIMGVKAAVGQRQYPETVRALTVCTALVLQPARFAELSASPGIAPALGTAMAFRARAAEEQVRNRLASYEAQLARVLLELSARAGVHDDDHIAIPVKVPQEILGTWIGASRATTNRTLGSLRKQGLLTTGYRTITITDPGRFRCVAIGDTPTETDHRQ